MPKASPIQSNFSGGEVSPFVKGRVDSDRYGISLDTCENYVPLLNGPITRRPGSRFVAEVKDSTKAVRLVRFIFSTTQAYILEFGDQYVRVYRNQGQVLSQVNDIDNITNANPAVLTYGSGSDPIANTDEIFITGVIGDAAAYLNGRNFRASNVDTGANTFQLNDLGGNAIDSSDWPTINPSDFSFAEMYEVYTVTTPYAEADLFELNFVQSTDTLFIVHPDYAPRTLTRTGHTSWTLATITFLNGPYLPENTTAVTLTPADATAATTTMTASSALFASTDVGRHLRYKASGLWTDFKITGYTSSTQVTVTRESSTVTNSVGTGALRTWRLGVWSDTTGYPGVVAFHEDRLCFAGATANPQRLDMSFTGDYYNFVPSLTVDSTDVITDDTAVSTVLNARDAENVYWMVSEERALLLGTPGGEWAIRPSLQSEPISQLNINGKQVAAFGSARIPPLYFGKATLFAQGSGRTLRELSYYYESDGFRAPDLTTLADHIAGDSGFKQFCRQRERPAITWAVRNDGQLAGMSYEREENVLIAAWHRHIFGGQSDASGTAALVESCEVIPEPGGKWDELWVVVKREMQGRVVRTIEYLGRIFEHQDEQKDAFHVDCGLTYDSPYSITGATAANPVVITASSFGNTVSNGDKVLISDVVGMSELNGNSYIVRNKTANTIELEAMDGTAVDGSAFAAYISGGYIRKYVTEVTGLWHLEGETVAVFGDGAVQPSVTVENGAVTLQNAATTIHFGFAIRSRGRRLRDEAGAADGTATGKTRRIHRVAFDLYRTLGFKFGMSFDNMEEISFRTSSDIEGRPPSLFTGIKSVTINGNYDFENQICWEQSGPAPGTILAVAPQLHTEDRG